MKVLPYGLALTLTFPNGQSAQTVQVRDRRDLAIALEDLGLLRANPVLVLTGGASNLNAKDFDRLEYFFAAVLAPLAEELGLTVVDGGTDTGVMQLMGRARAQLNASFPLVGVAPIGKIHFPSAISLAGTHPLEPHHTHFVLIPGFSWGDESPWLAEVASILAGNAPSVTVLINGGNVSLLDVQASLAEGRSVNVLFGTGRLADEIATAVRHPNTEVRAALLSLLQNGLKHDRFTVLDMSCSTVELATLLKQQLIYPVAPSPQPSRPLAPQSLLLPSQ